MVLPVRGRPGHITYRVDVDDEWRTVAVAAAIVSGPEEMELDLKRDASGWTVDGERRGDLAEAIDVDLGWTPATNTLPIRRLGLAAGERVELTVAWIRFPDPALLPMKQAYTNLGDDSWLYESVESGFTAEATVDRRGVVTHYGGLFETRAEEHRGRFPTDNAV